MEAAVFQLGATVASRRRAGNNRGPGDFGAAAVYVEAVDIPGTAAVRVGGGADRDLALFVGAGDTIGLWARCDKERTATDYLAAVGHDEFIGAGGCAQHRDGERQRQKQGDRGWLRRLCPHKFVRAPVRLNASFAVVGHDSDRFVANVMGGRIRRGICGGVLHKCEGRGRICH